MSRQLRHEDDMIDTWRETMSMLKKMFG